MTEIEEALSRDGYASLVASAQAYERRFVTLEREDGVATVTLDDPRSYNPLNPVLTVQLLQALEQAVHDESVRAVILTGRGAAFSAGGDLRSMAESVHPMVDESPEGATAIWRWIRYQFGGVVRLLVRSDKLFVSAVNGPAAGVGLAFALACDLVVASERAQLVTAFGRVGLIPEVGLGWLLTRRLGTHKTLELFIDGRPLDAAEACRLGLVNEVVPHEELLARARHWCDRAAELAPHSLQMAKPLLHQVTDLTWEQALAMEEFAEPMCFTTTGHREAVRAMLAGRKGGG